jgi:signal transduction histidine kinase
LFNALFIYLTSLHAMLQKPVPMPANESERLEKLAEFDIDYSDQGNNFKDLVYLAAKIAGTELSLVNLIDSFTQWTISSHGIATGQTPRTESICQHTIASSDYFEVKDLSKDERFKDKFYVNGPLNLQYYLGIPLATSEGVNIGALCVLDQNIKALSDEKIELLKIVADEVMNRLKSIKLVNELTYKLSNIQDVQKKVVHDIRNPIAGIIGLSDFISGLGNEVDIDEMLEFMKMIQKSGRSVLEMTDEILLEQKQEVLRDHEFNLIIFKEKLERLYLPQAQLKNINFEIAINQRTKFSPFTKDKLLQISGKLISNAIRFTPKGGTVTVSLDLIQEAMFNILKIRVTDATIDTDEKTITNIMLRKRLTLINTTGEKGYGEELPLIKQMVDSLQGKLTVKSSPGAGATFEVVIQQSYR